MQMFFMNGNEIGGKDDSGKREDLAFIVRFNWKTANHLKEAIQVLLSARLESVSESSGTCCSARTRSEVLDEAEFCKIRLQIASNPHTPPPVLAYLSRHGTGEVLERVAENPRTPDYILSKLAGSANSSVRQAIAENLNTAFDTLAALATDENPDVRYRLAENPHTPEAILEMLVEDDNPYVSERANDTLNRLSAGCVLEADFQSSSGGWSMGSRQALG